MGTFIKVILVIIVSVLFIKSMLNNVNASNEYLERLKNTCSALGGSLHTSPNKKPKCNSSNHTVTTPKDYYE